MRRPEALTPLSAPQGGNFEERAQKNIKVQCPFCGSQNTTQEAAFGTTHAYSQFYCRACRTPFEWIKWEEREIQSDLPSFLQSS